MKYFLLFVLSLCSYFSFGQVKGNNAIIVKSVGFIQVKETLLDAGIFIDEQNAEDGTIITKKKGYCECPNKDFYQLIYYIRIKDSVATIRGKWDLDAPLNNGFSEVVYWKAKTSAMHYLFGIMIEFAKSLNGTSIEFKTL